MSRLSSQDRLPNRRQAVSRQRERFERQGTRVMTESYPSVRIEYLLVAPYMNDTVEDAYSYFTNVAGSTSTSQGKPKSARLEYQQSEIA